jgi:putative transposase
MRDTNYAYRDWRAASKEIHPDQIHLFVSVPPTIAMADALRVLEGVMRGCCSNKLPL